MCSLYVHWILLIILSLEHHLDMVDWCTFSNLPASMVDSKILMSLFVLEFNLYTFLLIISFCVSGFNQYIVFSKNTKKTRFYIPIQPNSKLQKKKIKNIFGLI